MSDNANPTNPSQASVRERFKAYLTQKGLRVTNQRMAIVDAALIQSGHFTAEGLLDAARAIDSSVSRATIYRSLPILVEGDLIREVDVGRDYKYYTTNQPNTAFQAQVICEDCDKIFEQNFRD